MKERITVLKTIIGTIIILLVLLFIPDNVLPEYNIIGYSIISGLFLILASLKTTAQTDITSILRDLTIYFTILIPLGIMLFTNIKYKIKIKDSAKYVDLYNTLKFITTLLLGIQTYQIYQYIFSDNLTFSFYLGIAISSILNISTSSLLWSRIAFFITDGFTNK